MNLLLDASQTQALVAQHPRLAHLCEALRLSHRIEVPSGQLALAELHTLAALLAPADADANSPALGPVAQVRGLIAARAAGGPTFGQADDLEQLLPAMAAYLGEGAQRGWLFAMQASGRPLPWVVTRLDYIAPSNEEMGKVLIELKAHVRLGIVSQTLRIAEADLRGLTVPELLAAKGWLKESPELLAAYDAMAERYLAWRAHHGQQFCGQGMGFHAEDPSASHRDVDWTRKDQLVLSTSGAPARLVNDEGVLPPRSAVLDTTGDILGPYLRKAAKSNRYSAEDAVQTQREALAAGLFTQLPLHGYVFMFHLELHQHLWVHVLDVQPYVYRPDLKSSLVLPPEQTDLIDILTAEMDVLMDDIVAGKGGGTTVLCAGPPGVGKTLTAEVYAEIVGRPLYRVHSGQLGLNVASMEHALKEALTRAQRWGAVMLIDEADVYIKRRDDDITMNAVVGVFLRVLEYFNGLLFLTTNRLDDIDEAIVSRCIALIRYHAPDEAARQRIWQVMAAQFGLVLDEVECRRLAQRFASASGRDIKGLAKLVAKYCQHKDEAPTPAVFERCAVFRGLDGLPAPLEQEA